MTPDEKRRARLELLHVIQMVNPIGEPFNDALFLCATALAADDPDLRGRSRQKIASRLKMQSALMQAFQTAVVVAAKEAGHGQLPFPEAAEAIGTDFGALRRYYLSQLEAIVL